MSKLIVWLSCIVAIIFSIYVLMDNPGFVSITWFGYVIETSVAFCLSLLAILFFSIYLIRIPKRWINLIKASLKNKRAIKNKALLVQILSNILCKDFKPNEKLIKKFQRTETKNSELVLLLTALSKTDNSVYKQLAKKTETQKAGLHAMINEHIERGEIILAIEEVEKLLNKNPKQDWILNEAFSLYILNEEWKKALTCLENLYKLKAIDVKQYNYQKAVLLVKLDQGFEAFKLSPSLPIAAIMAAKEKPQKAEKIYQRAWEEHPCFEVYEAYVKLYAKENSLSRYKHVLKLCAANKNAKINPLVIADAAINAQLWSEAKKELNGYLVNNPLTINIGLQMVRIEIEANHNLKEAQKWIEKTSRLETSLDYICYKCGYKTVDWLDRCPVCNQFAGLNIS